MADAPAFYATPHLEVNSLTTGSTAVDGTGDSVIVYTANVASKVEEVYLKSGGSNVARPADSTVRLFLVTPAAVWHNYKTIDLGAPAAGSTTAASYESTPLTFENLILPAGWKMGATVTVTPTAGTIEVYVHGNDA